MKKKTAAIFDPYLDILGGGEVYTASVAECLMNNGFEVDIFWKNDLEINKLKTYLGIDLKNIKVNHFAYWLYSQPGNLINKRKLIKNYDLAFWLSDGSIPWLFTSNNILHFQIPFIHIKGRTLQNKIKLHNIHHIICNSYFTKKHIDQTYAVFSDVLYPPINIKTKESKKQNTILSVGRFTTSLHNKRQDILLEIFKQLVDQGLKDWKLKLIGGTQEKEGKSLVKNLRENSDGYPIQIISNITHQRVMEEYSQAKIFWHAAGYGIDEEREPEKVEHFGISTVEAMAAGCVPVVINKGGQPEIINNLSNGFLWNTLDELNKKTKYLINNENILNKIAIKAKKLSRKFSKQRFCQELSQYLS